MFIFGHLGIGNAITQPFSKGLKARWLFLGMILPDLIDKPLYYSLRWFHLSEEILGGLISGTRTFGHTGIFLLVLTLLAFFRKSKTLAALSLGLSSHLLLDGTLDYFMFQFLGGSTPGFSRIIFWPSFGLAFPGYPFTGLTEHLAFWERPEIYWTESLGFLFLFLYFIRKKRPLL